ncbi:MAG: hydantoinase B/oxoprolinase family protein [Ardenticatenaceae bacterium]
MPDPITIQVIRNALIAAAKEMQTTLVKTAHNPLIYEVRLVSLWGAMVNDGRSHVQSGCRWIGLFPGLAIFITTMAFNLLGDGVQTAMDPRIRGT